MLSPFDTSLSRTSHRLSGKKFTISTKHLSRIWISDWLIITLFWEAFNSTCLLLWANLNVLCVYSVLLEAGVTVQISCDKYQHKLAYTYELWAHTYMSRASKSQGNKKNKGSSQDCKEQVYCTKKHSQKCVHDRSESTEVSVWALSLYRGYE